MKDLQELDGLCAFLEERHPWRYVALARLRASIQRSELLDQAIALHEPLRAFLRQGTDERTARADSFAALKRILS